MHIKKLNPKGFGDSTDQDNPNCYQFVHAHKTRGVGVVCYQ